jgi:PPP family 3-phenylpropionic acid transporter
LRRAVPAYIVYFIAISAWSPYLSLYYQSLGITLGQIGVIMALASTVGMISSPMWGALHDRYPHSVVLLPLAGLIGGLGGYGLATVGATPLILPAAAMFSCGTAGIGPMIDVRVLELTGSDRTRYGRIRAVGSASFMIGAPLVGLLKDHEGPGSIFWVLIPAILIGTLLATTIPGRTRVVRAASLFRAPGEVLRYRPVAVFLIGYLICFIAINAQASYLGPYLHSLGASNELVGWAAALGAAFEIPSMVFFPRLARRFGVERLILVGALGVALRQIANITFVDPNVLVLCSMLQGSSYALLVVGGVTFVSRKAPKGTAATAQGLLSGAVLSLSAIIGNGGGGQLAALLTIRGMYAVTVLIGCAGVVAIALAMLPFLATRHTGELPDTAPSVKPA